MSRVLSAVLLLVGFSYVLLSPAPPALKADSSTQQAQRAEPRPLKPLMVTLGQDMSRIADGIWYEDFEMIRTGAQAIADHPKIPPAQMQLIRKTLGEQFSSFVGMDKAVHDAAVEVAEAAAEHNLQRALQDVESLQRGCVACHTAYRDTVRSAFYQTTSR